MILYDNYRLPMAFINAVRNPVFPIRNTTNTIFLTCKI